MLLSLWSWRRAFQYEGGLIQELLTSHVSTVRCGPIQASAYEESLGVVLGGHVFSNLEYIFVGYQQHSIDRLFFRLCCFDPPMCALSLLAIVEVGLPFDLHLDGCCMLVGYG